MKMLAMPRAKADLPNVQCDTFQTRLSTLVASGFIMMPARTCIEDQLDITLIVATTAFRNPHAQQMATLTRSYFVFNRHDTSDTAMQGTPNATKMRLSRCTCLLPVCT
ncbi:TPA: hypothetical protein ACH3X1_014316 [Trebouxia sp. C0004]